MRAVCVCVSIHTHTHGNTITCPSILYRQKRIAEMQAAQMKAKFGSLREITAQDYVDEVNKAGDGVWVVLHLYRSGYPLLSLCQPVWHET